MNTFLFYLVLLMPGTDKPTLVLMQVHPTAAECLVVLERAPADVRGKFACIEINMAPVAILERNKV